MKRNTNLSTITLRGLYTDILAGSAEEGRFVFEDYVLNISKKNSKKHNEDSSEDETIIKVKIPMKKKVKWASHQKLYWQRKNNGLCTKCGVVKTPNIYCTKCTERRKHYNFGSSSSTYNKERAVILYNKRKAKGSCVGCGAKERAIGRNGREILHCRRCAEIKHKYDAKRNK